MNDRLASNQYFTPLSLTYNRPLPDQLFASAASCIHPIICCDAIDKPATQAYRFRRNDAQLAPLMSASVTLQPFNYQPTAEYCLV
jgi:hypothetical protein